jgi:hypothetical protein
MSEYSRFLAWDRRCIDRGSYGMTSGDSMALGLRDYNQPYPCPNGLPLDARQPGDCEHWRKRVAKAKLFITDWDKENRVRSVADSITDEEILLEIEIVRQWQHSQKQAQHQTGSHALTQAELS